MKIFITFFIFAEFVAPILLMIIVFKVLLHKIKRINQSKIFTKMGNI